MDDVLDRIAIRVIRDGKPVSVFVNELWHLTEQDLVEMPRGMSDAIQEAMAASNAWGYDDIRMIWINLPAACRACESER
jgi:hypothetical protein